MKIKELHLRNIASIESADIDFEKDLIDRNSGASAPLFWISGDTGTGKSVLLDGISMALYKKTPRTSSVVNKTLNNYKDNKTGEEIRIDSIEQYTRIGISEKDPCYSEVVFEGNDNVEYRAKLTLGILLGNKDKVTGERPIKHRNPVWELKIGSEDWTRDNVQSTIQGAVGLSFEQFGRMAMLAQGQFASFLTGDKKERESILEQLTNTEKFSKYGEAINSLFTKSKNEKNSAQVAYDTEKAHALSNEEVNELKQKLKELNDAVNKKNAKIKAKEDILNQLGIIETETTNQNKAQLELTALQEKSNSDEYREKTTLINDWDNTARQRQSLSNLKKAINSKTQSETVLKEERNTFIELASDLLFKEQELNVLENELKVAQEWIEEHKTNDKLFTQADAICVKLENYKTNLDSKKTALESLSGEQEKTEALKQQVICAQKEYDDAVQNVTEKKVTIEILALERNSLKPDEIKESLRVHNERKVLLSNLKNRLEKYSEAIRATERTEEQIRKDNEQLSSLNSTYDQAEKEFQQAKATFESAQQRFQTMNMSMDEALASLRSRLMEEHTDICPLCGQNIEKIDFDFSVALNPLKEEQQEASKKLDTATKKRDTAKSEYDQLAGSIKSRCQQLKEAQKTNNEESVGIHEQIAQNGWIEVNDTDIEIVLETANKLNEEQIAAHSQKQENINNIQKQIDQLIADKTPLDNIKAEKYQALTNAQQAIKDNSDNIVRIKKEIDSYDSRNNDIEQGIAHLLDPYLPDWKTTVSSSIDQIKARGKEYSDYKTKADKYSNDHKIKQGEYSNLLNAKNQCTELVPDWKTIEVTPKQHVSKNIHTDWTTLYGNINTACGNIITANAGIEENQKSLNDYYTNTGKTENELVELSKKESIIPSTRTEVDQLKREIAIQEKAITDSSTKINDSRQRLGLQEKDPLPDKQKLTDEKDQLKSERDATLKDSGSQQNKLDENDKNSNTLTGLKSSLDAANAKFDKWNLLNSYFGGTRFRTLVQTYILRPLLNNANIYLEKITDRYQLTCSEDNEQLSILVLDKYNKNQVRSATVLSGGERFMISLALSLALSSLNRSDMNINILFIDEGFGTLDEKSLDSVMSTLEKLQEIAGQSKRRVGIISHREELEDRIPVQIHVTKKGEGRSFVKIIQK